jgi:5-deoxy-5-amino-3-dehydroquinate synthase
VGAFWQPVAVLCDTEALDSLPGDEYRSGCGEMAKYHFLGGEGMERLPLEERIARCVALKAEVVADDEREAGRRAVLNYGHTLAHALETAGGYGLRHGEAVAVGLIFAAHLAHRLGRIDESRLAHHYQVVRSFGLPETAPAGIEHEDLMTLMGRDKKSSGPMTFVLDGPRGVEPVPDVAPADVEAALADVSR